MIQKLVQDEDNPKVQLENLDILAIAIASNPTSKEGMEQWVEFTRALKESKKVKSIDFRDNLHESNFGKLTLEQWFMFFSAIAANPSLQSVVFSRIRFGHMNINLFKGLMAALSQNPNLIHFELKQDETHIMQMSQAHWQALLVLAKQKPLSITLDDNFSFCWNTDNLQGLHMLVTQGQVVSLNLWGSHLSQMSNPCWEILCKTIANAKQLVTLNLEMNGLGNIIIERMKMLCESLANCHTLKKLLIGRNLFSYHQCRNLLLLCNYLAGARNLEVLHYYDDMDNNNFVYALQEQDIKSYAACHQLLFSAISENKSLREVSLNLAVAMFKFPPKLIEYMQTVIHKSRMQALSFRGCNIAQFNDEAWKFFWNGIKDSGQRKILSEAQNFNALYSFKYLDFSNNNLGTVSYARFRDLCRALKGQPLKHLNLSSNNLNTLSQARLEMLYKTLQSCELLTSVCIDEMWQDFPENYQNKLNSVPLQATKGIFFAAAQSLLNAHIKIDNQSKRQTKENHDRKSLPKLNTDCIDLILSFLPARLPKPGTDMVQDLQNSRNARVRMLEEELDETFTKNATEKQYRELRKSVIKSVVLH